MAGKKAFWDHNKARGLYMADDDCAKVHFYLDCALIVAMGMGIASMISFLAVL